MATVTAAQSAPVRTGATAAAGSPGSSDGSDTGFGALLAALVPVSPAVNPAVSPAVSPGGVPAGTTTPAPTPTGVCGAGPEVSVSPDEVVVGAADSTQVVVGAAGDDAAGSRTGDPGTGDASVTTDGTDATASAPTADPVLGVDAALLAQAQLAALPLLTATAPVVAVGSAQAGTAGTAGTGATEGTDVAVDAMGTEDLPAGLAATDAVVAPESGAGTGDQPTQQSPDQQPTAAPAPVSATPAPAPDAASATAAVTATAAASPAAPVVPSAAARSADAVPGQVFPEVVRLSQAGPGTHRMVLRLDPGTLGEVRVTLTVRDGEVQVRLAAQHDAREVLAQAAPDLRRLLEQSGTVDARVAVADLTSGTTTDLAGDAWSGRGPSGDTGDGSDQRPASYDERPGGTRAEPEPPPAVERPRGTRTAAGLDLAL